MRWTLQIVWNYFLVQYWQLCTMHYSERWLLLASCASISRRIESCNDPTVVASSPAGQFMALRTWTHWEDSDSDRWTTAVLMRRHNKELGLRLTEWDPRTIIWRCLPKPESTGRTVVQTGMTAAVLMKRRCGDGTDELGAWGWQVECREPRPEASRTSS